MEMVDLFVGQASKAAQQPRQQRSLLKSYGQDGCWQYATVLDDLDHNRDLPEVHDVIASKAARQNQNASMMKLPPPGPRFEDGHYLLRSQRCVATTTSFQQVSTLVPNPQDPDQLPPMSDDEPTIADLSRLTLSLIEGQRRLEEGQHLLKKGQHLLMKGQYLLIDHVIHVEKILSNVAMLEAEKQCDLFAVDIKMEKVNETPVGGHGVVVYANDHYYLKSCLHVFLDAWNSYGLYGNFTITIAWANRPQKRIQILLKNLLIPTCIADDLHYVDIAMHKIDFITPPIGAEIAAVEFETRSLRGRKVLAKSTTRMEGCANELRRPGPSSVNTAYNEYISTATAKLGTSGNATFDNTDICIGLVRGRGNVDASSAGMSERLAQSSHFGVSPAGLLFAEVDPSLPGFLQWLIAEQRSKPVDMDLRTVIKDHLNEFAEPFSVEDVQETIHGIFNQEGMLVDFGPDANGEVHMELVKVSKVESRRN